MPGWSIHSTRLIRAIDQTKTGNEENDPQNRRSKFLGAGDVQAQQGRAGSHESETGKKQQQSTKCTQNAANEAFERSVIHFFL